MTNPAVSEGERTCSVPFHDLWEAALATIAGLRHWSVIDSDPRAGILRITTADRLGRNPLDGTLRVSLDEMGQTRLEIQVTEPSRLLRPRGGGRRIRRFLAALDATLSPRRGGARKGH